MGYSLVGGLSHEWASFTLVQLNAMVSSIDFTNHLVIWYISTLTALAYCEDQNPSPRSWKSPS